MKLTDLEIPVTPACRAALDVATAYCSPALLNHSVRAYLWAAGYGFERGIAFDAELLYVSAMLHDLALVKEFDNHTLPFEGSGRWSNGSARNRCIVAQNAFHTQIITSHCCRISIL
jgi:hypothetical protein